MQIRIHMDEELPLGEQNPPQTKRSGFLYRLLASLLKLKISNTVEGSKVGKWFGSRAALGAEKG